MTQHLRAHLRYRHHPALTFEHRLASLRRRHRPTHDAVDDLAPDPSFAASASTLGLPPCPPTRLVPRAPPPRRRPQRRRRRVPRRKRSTSASSAAAPSVAASTGVGTSDRVSCILFSLEIALERYLEKLEGFPSRCGSALQNVGSSRGVDENRKNNSRSSPFSLLPLHRK